MKPRVAQLFPVLLALGLALATLWLERVVQLVPLPGKATERHDPDFIVEHFTLTRMNANGHPDAALTAAKMVHFPDDDSTALEQPKYVQRAETQPPIEIVADEGTVSKDGEVVHVFGNVVVTRAGVDGRAPLRVETTAMEIRPKEETARTTEPVVIIEGETRLAGVGMEVNNKTREFELKSRVRGTYVSPAK